MGNFIGVIIDEIITPQAGDEVPRDVAVHDYAGNEELLPYEAKGPPLLLVSGLPNLASALELANEIALEIREGVYRWEDAEDGLG